MKKKWKIVQKTIEERVRVNIGVSRAVWRFGAYCLLLGEVEL